MTVTISVDIDAAAVMAGLEVMPAALGVEVEKGMVEATLLVEGEVKALTPRRTGRLFSGWESRVEGVGGEVTGIVANRVSYAGYIEEGTKPHEIVAHGRALMIPMTKEGGFGGARLSGLPRVGQQVAFFKRVHHPGFGGRHMARIAVDTALPAVKEIFARAAQRAIGIAFHK
jgi:hypothetical protein